MDKILLLKLCVGINMVILFIFCFSFFAFDKYQSSYFNIGWSKDFIFISSSIDTPLRYFTLCSFIIVFNISEIFLNDIAMPLIQFSTYNPYKTVINDFGRLELEVYSNTIFFIQTVKRFVQIYVTFSQIDIAIISIVSSQTGVGIAIHYLLDRKEFVESEQYIELPYRTDEFIPITLNRV